ncbi:hypothetical protein VYU27_006903 [Nannochloropsis oceanica]
MGTPTTPSTPQRNGERLETRPLDTSSDKVNGGAGGSKTHEVSASISADLLGYFLAVLILLNFWSAAFLELVMYVVFAPMYPPIWHATRILGVRFGWLPPMIFLKWANIRLRVTGHAAAASGLGTMPSSSSSSWSSSWQRYIDLFTPGKLPRALIMINHLSWADSFVLSPWLHAHNSVNGDTCWPMWRGFINMPLGWIAYMSECPVLGYGKEMDLETIRKSVSRFFQRRMTKFFLFPEGAVFRECMLQKSHEYAQANNLPLLDHCLLPKHGAFLEAGQALHRQGMETLVDITIAYPPTSSLYNAPFNVIDLVKYHPTPLYVHLNVRTFDMREIPWEEEDKVRQWLTRRFEEKDRFLDDYYKGKGGVMVEGGKEEGPRWRDLTLDVLLWMGVQVVMYTVLYALGARVLGRMTVR